MRRVCNISSYKFHSSCHNNTLLTTIHAKYFLGHDIFYFPVFNKLAVFAIHIFRKYEGVSESFRTGRLERERQMV